MTNPVNQYFAEKTSAKQQRKQNELDLLHRWRTEGEQPEHLAPLLKLYEPVIAQHVRKHKVPAIPASALKAKVQEHVIDAFKTYDPSRGAALNTWVESRLPKVGRYRNRYQNLAYIPEGQAEHIGKIQVARNTLSEELGREPTVDELGDHLGLTPKRLQTILSSIKRDVPMGRSGGPENYDYTAGAEPTGRAFEEQEIAVAKNTLPTIFPNRPDLHTVFNHVFGTNGHEQITSTGELAKRMGKTAPQISRLKSEMGSTLRQHMGLDEENE